MKEMPMLYSTPMIKAKLAGRKTQTRRVMKVQPDNNYYSEMKVLTDVVGNAACLINYNQGDKNPYVRCPYGNIGDLIWARETWAYAEDEFGNHSSTTNGDCFGRFLYKANGDDNHGRWKPSIHMPKAAARIYERITNIRVERLQDISEEDAIAEGVGCGFQMNSGWPDYTRIVNGICEVTQDSAQMSYATLWESINGEGSWELNPWCWCITTEILSTTGRPKSL